MLNYVILVISIVFLIISLILSFFQPTAASILFNFFTTVIASWLLSNLANEKAFKKKQEDLAKVSYRHLGDVEKSALSIEQSIKDFIYTLSNNKDLSDNKELSDARAVLFLETLDSRMDDLKDRIKSTNRDWYDLLADDVKREIDKIEDPEAKLPKNASTLKPDLSGMANMFKDIVRSDEEVV